MKTKQIRFLSAVLAVIMLIGIMPLGAMAAGINPGTGKVSAVTTESGKGMVGDDYNNVISQRNYPIIPGVTETNVILNDATGTNQNMCYAMEVDLSSSVASVMPSYKDMNPNVWGTQIMSKQAEAAEAMGYNVVGGINVNLSWESDEPIGMLVIDGVVHHNSVYSGSYLVVDREGNASLRDGNVPLDGSEWQAITVNFGWLVRDGVSCYTTPNHSTPDRAPRTAIGIKADGKLVLFVVDGRQAPTSVGMTMYELSQAMLNMGCVQAVNCDGGGSSTFLSEREGTGELSVKNSPSDGVERPTLGGLLVLSTAKPSGVFDHAAIFPGNEIYTPGTSVQFNANGVDSGGLVVDLPEGLTYALSEDSANLGTIDAETGLFTAGNAEGIVTVQLKNGDEVVGSTTIEIAAPDSIYFETDEISLGFEAETDFNIVVRNQSRDINYKDGDLVWTLSDERLGTFNGNIFTSSDGESLNGTVTVTSAFDPEITAQIRLIVGMLPTIVLDFEDYVDPETGAVIPAEEYYTIGTSASDGSYFYTANYGRGGRQSAEIVSIDDNEPVRFGSHSLKLNFDFTNCGAVTEGACFGTSSRTDIPGMPTAIGVWVYAPEGVGIEWGGDGTQAGFWLRGYVRDGSGGNQAYDFTFEPKVFTGDPSGWPDEMPGIYWEGWKYCEADLTKFTGPFSIQPGMTFRLMYVYGTKMGTKTAGSLYFDNLQFVYGANVDDVDSPVVHSILANDVELENDSTLTTNTVTFSASVFDVENKYTSGIDTVRMFIDGVNVYDNEHFNFAIDPDGSRCFLYNVELTDGQHSISVVARDKFGNETTETRYFTVEGGEVETASVSIGSIQTSAILGQTVDIEVRASDVTAITANTTEFKLNNLFPDYAVTFGTNYTGTVAYNTFTKTITVDASRIETVENAEDTLIAKLTVQVPSTLNSSAAFSYIVKSGIYTLEDGKLYTYSRPEQILPVSAMYIVSADPIIIGMSGIIRVNDANGQPVSGINVYLTDNTLVGTTSEDGSFTTDIFSSTAGKYTVFAQDAEGNVSFYCDVISYNPCGDETGAAYGVLNNATANPDTHKSITWFSNPSVDAAQYITYCAASSDEWITIPATQTILTFSKGSYDICTSNSVTLTELTPGTTYNYRLGFEGNWSETMSFTTQVAGSDVNFFIIGDIQAEDLTNVNAILSNINQGSYNFGIQTGDAVDDATSYNMWQGVVDLFDYNKLGGTDLIHVLGNHEYAGDANGFTAASVFSHPEAYMGSHYSVTYGNVYVAVINYTGNRSQLAEALEWLRQDAAASSATWKVLSMHQPSYYTNITGGNAEINEMVPPVLDELGFDFAFSGHDHSYARTAPMTAGQVNENGVTYFICGSAGEKSYAVTPNPAFNFEVATQDYNAVYLSISADNDKFVVNAYNVTGDGSFQLLDSYTKLQPRCENDEHSYVYNRDTDMLTCEACGHRMCAGENMYSGWANESVTGRLMYFVGGRYQTGYQFISSTPYFFENNGFAYNGDYILCGETCQFEDGVYTGCTTANLLTAGMCGPTAEYVLYSTGLFKLGGEGEMYDHALYGTVAWRAFCPNIRSIEVGSGITTIGTYAFRGCYNCTSVVFATNSNLESINSYAFQNLNKMSSITLPEGLTTLRGNAFIYCTSLRDVYMPESLLSIHANTFARCSDITLNVASGSYAEYWAIAHNFAYATRGASAPFVIKNGTCGESIEWSLTSDGKLTLSGSGEMFSYTAAKDVPWHDFAEAIRTVNIAAGITTIGDFAFHGSSNLRTVVFEHGSAVTRLYRYAFSGCSALTELVLPDAVTRIDYAAFQSCNALTSLFMPIGVTNINDAAFVGTNNVVLNVYEGSYAHDWAVEHGIAFETRTMDPNTVLYEGSIGDAAWTITYDGTLTISGSGEFPKMANAYAAPWYTHRAIITSIVVDKDFTTIGDFAFYGLYNVTRVTFEEDSVLACIYRYAFARCSSLSEVLLPESVTRIEYAAFQCNNALTSVYMPIGVNRINTYAFVDSSNVVLNVFEGSYSHNWAIQNGVAYTTRTIDPETVLYNGVCGSNTTWVITYGGTLYINGTGAINPMTNAYSAPWYQYRSLINRIDIASGITSIGDFAFFGLENVTEVTFGENSALTRVFRYGFARCYSLREVNLPDSLTRLDYAAFQCNYALVNAFIPIGVTNINNYAFTDSDNIILNVYDGSYAHRWAIEHNVAFTIVSIDPSTVLYSGTYNNINWTINYGGELYVSGEGTIDPMTNAYSSPWYVHRDIISSIRIGSGIISVGDFAFYGLSNAETIVFDEGCKVTRFFRYAFARCSAVTEIILPETVRRIDYAAFQCNFALTSMYVPAGVNNIHRSAFMDTTGVTLSVAAGSYAHNFAIENGIAHQVRPVD